MKNFLKNLLKIETLTVAIFFVLVIAVAVIVILDKDKVDQVISEANSSYLLWALLSTLLAYAFMTGSFVLANKLFKIDVKTTYIALVGFITIAIGNLLDFGGVGGYSLRVALLKQKGARICQVMASTLFHVYITFFTLLTLLPIAFITLLATNRLEFPSHLPLVYIMCFTTIALIVASWLLTARRARKKIETFATKLVLKVTKKDFGQRFQNFNIALDTGLDLAKKRPQLLAGMTALTLIGWGFAIATMGFCFRSIGVELGLPELASGLGVGVTVAYFGVIPGGLGVQDGSMAGVYTLFGVPFEISVFASIVLRVVYYLVPAMLGLCCYALFLKSNIKNGTNPISTTNVTNCNPKL